MAATAWTNWDSPVYGRPLSWMWSNLFIKNKTAYAILSSIALVITAWVVFRLFSKNLSKRRAENALYMSKGGVPHAPGPVPQSG